MDVFDQAVTLFESGEDEEHLVVECTMTQEGELLILQESAGPLTAWCFEESPHRIEVVAGPDAVEGLAGFFKADEPRQLPALLRFECAGYDASWQVRSLMRRLGLGYQVIEQPVVR